MEIKVYEEVPRNNLFVWVSAYFILSAVSFLPFLFAGAIFDVQMGIDDITPWSVWLKYIIMPGYAYSIFIFVPYELIRTRVRETTVDVDEPITLCNNEGTFVHRGQRYKAVDTLVARIEQ